MALLSSVVGRGIVASRPAAGSAGALYYATDVNGGQLQRDNGSTWDSVEASGTFSGEVSGTDVKATGLTGATAASRYVGATASGAPASGTFAVGDFVIDQTGKVWVCTTAGTPGTWTQAGGGGGSGLYSAYICCQEQEASGTAGGTFTSGAWRTRVLNTKVADTGSHCSLASNQMTLDAGTYDCLISAPAFYVNINQTRLQNITDSTTIAMGTPESADNSIGQGQTSRSFLVTTFTLASAKVLEVQHQCAVTRATNGLGLPASLGGEVYTIAQLWKR